MRSGSIYPIYPCGGFDQNHHSAGTPIDCSCLISSGFAENDEVVAVEDFIDVGNIPGKSWLSLLKGVGSGGPSLQILSNANAYGTMQWQCSE